MDGPSSRLIELLRRTRLCSPTDLRKCRSLVRRLAGDLPSFDSVWIDALVQTRKLTPFQARMLESPRPEDLAVGPCLLVERLGGGRRGETFLARHRDGAGNVALKRVHATAAPADRVLQRLEQLADSLKGLGCLFVAEPRRIVTLTHGPAVVSAFVAGPHLGELLVRRGRFPADVVLDLGRQLVDGLVALERRGVVHGDIRTANIRVNKDGIATLLDPGVSTAIEPTFRLTDDVPPECYDGVAPELIETAGRPTAATDVYALGCLLWQLLAGRPPYLTADPLSKLASHQTKDIEDVRHWAPHTPAPLAESLLSMTARNPQQRPQNAREIQQRWGAATITARRRLGRFRADVRSPVMTSRPAKRSGLSWTVAVVLLTVAFTAAMALSDAGARTRLLQIAAPVQRLWKPDESDSAPHSRQRDSQAAIPESKQTPLPPPDPNGVILLPHAGPYAWRPIDGVGRVVIRGAAGVRPVVLVDRPCRISADTVTIENVHFQSAGTLASVLVVATQNLILRGCTVSGRRPAAHEIAATAPMHDRPAAVSWTVHDTKDGSGRRLVVRNCVFADVKSGVAMSNAVQRAEFDNCLHLNSGPLMHVVRSRSSPASPAVLLRRVTLRKSAGLMIVSGVPPVNAPPIRVAAGDCVLALHDGGPLFECDASPGRYPIRLATLQGGSASLISKTAQIAVWRDAQTGSRRTADPASLSLEGLLAAPFQFAGPADALPANSAIVSFRGPRSGNSLPGIDPKRLPQL